ncbi:hypothetical protein LINGRAHAP2_LOCUS35094 [Linum grandiflorum]
MCLLTACGKWWSMRTSCLSVESVDVLVTIWRAAIVVFPTLFLVNLIPRRQQLWSDAWL